MNSGEMIKSEKCLVDHLHQLLYKRKDGDMYDILWEEMIKESQGRHCMRKVVYERKYPEMSVTQRSELNSIEEIKRVAKDSSMEKLLPGPM
uniref:Uncharacterized protein n=1 Tax=Arion vulgaris TaxID=1028688 RepID=A0A0B7AXU8_9EUPU